MQTPLTDRQERFVFEYLKDQNASAAAERAGYTAKNMASQGNELMNNPASVTGCGSRCKACSPSCAARRWS